MATDRPPPSGRRSRKRLLVVGVFLVVVFVLALLTLLGLALWGIGEVTNLLNP